MLVRRSPAAQSRTTGSRGQALGIEPKLTTPVAAVRVSRPAYQPHIHR
jgi:hypothetical protein